MKKEHIMDAMDYIDPALVAAADGPVSRRGRKGWARYGLIAACLCLALAGTAFAAAQAFSVRVNFQAKDPLDVPDMEMYTVTGGMTYFPEDIFSQEVRELAQADTPARSFQTWDELEQFVGRDLMNNPVLEGALPGVEAKYGRDMEGATHILLAAHSKADSLFHISADDHYMLDDVLLMRSVSLYTDAAQADFEDREPESGWYYDDGAQLSQEEYTTPNGLTATIVQVSGRSTKYQAHFSINGVLCHISAYYQGTSLGAGPDRAEHTLAVLKQALDGFVLN